MVDPIVSERSGSDIDVEEAGAVSCGQRLLSNQLGGKIEIEIRKSQLDDHECFE
jgi:hypothetical protein